MKLRSVRCSFKLVGVCWAPSPDDSVKRPNPATSAIIDRVAFIASLPNASDSRCSRTGGSRVPHEQGNCQEHTSWKRWRCVSRATPREAVSAGESYTRSEENVRGIMVRLGRLTVNHRGCSVVNPEEELHRPAT